MLASKHKQWVLETIQCLRQRKARPDLERIHKLAGRSHGLTINEIRESLRKLTEEGMVLKVNSRGHMSYRPFNKTVSSVSTSPQNQVYNTSVRILYALRNIMKTTGDGVSFSELENWLVSKNPETRLVKHRLENALVKELKASTITKLSDNCYVLTDTLPKSVPNACVAAEINNTAKDQNLTKKKTETTDSLTLTEKENAKETENTIRGRPLSKRKKFKKTHGPDFENPLLLKKLASKDVIKDVTQDVKCSFCSGTVNSNLQGKKEQLLTCKDCNTKVHPTCMDYSDELAQRALNSPWQCTECKTCCVCDGAQNAKLLLFCDACDMGYHMLCHTQPVSSKPKGKWVCSACKNDQTKPSVADVSDVKPSNKKDSSKPDNISVVLCDEEEDTMETRGKKRKLGQTPGLPLKRQRSVPSKSGEDVRSTTTSPADSPVTSPAKSPVTSPAKSPLTSPFKSSITSLVKSSVTPSVVEEPVFDDFTDGTVGASCLPTPSPSPTPGDTFDYEMQMSLCGSTFPLLEDATLYTDATDWCMEEVVAFFEGCGFKDCVQTFKEQEIDGRSLLLMKRNDVLTGLGLKLGPALKIHQKIVKLQFHSQAVMSLS